MSNRILFIGLDGYDPALGEEWIAAGKLPHLARLAARSARVPLEHGPARRTGLAWEHFATGLDPQAADRYSAVHFDPERYTIEQHGTRLAPFLRDMASDAVVFDAPYLDLTRARGTRGFVGWGAHDPGVPTHSYPLSLQSEVTARFGDYPATPWIYGHTWPSTEQTQRSGKDLVTAVERRADITRWLLAERFPDWQLGISVVSEPHSAIEAMWHGVDACHPLHAQSSATAAREALMSVYQAVDRYVGDMEATFPDVDLMVVSIHGMGPNDADLPSMAALPELLYRHQFGKALMKGCHPPGGDALITPPAGENWSNSMKRCFEPTAANREKHVAAAPRKKRRRGMLERRLRGWAKSALAPVRHQLATHSVDWMPAAWYRQHWPDMQAFALPAFYDGQIRINLRGREARGSIEPGSYQETLAALEALIAECRDIASGSPVVKAFVRSERPDPLDMGPSEADLTVVWQGSITGLRHPELGDIGPFVLRRPGGHTGGNGMAWIRSGQVGVGDFATRSAFDVVPTLYELLGRTPQHPLSGSSFLSALHS